MRTSVKIKNFIAKAMLVTSVLTFIAVGSNVENMNLSGMLIIAASVIVGRLGYKLWQW